MQATQILETCLYVDDLVAAEDFYSRIFGLKRISRVEGRHVFFRCGDGVFLLFNPEATSRPSSSASGVPAHGARGPGHVAFAMRHADIDAWRDHLQQNDVEIEKELTWPGGGYSIYFRDPAGNSVELATPKTWGEVPLSQPAPETTGHLIHWARHYDTVVNLLALGRAQALRQATIDLARIEPGEQVLDVGCGTGDLTIGAKTKAGPAGRVVGIDASPEMIDVARRKAARAGVDVDFRIEIVEQMSFPDRSFDVVLSSLMMHHLSNDLKRRGLLEIHRVLKPGGRVLIVDARRPESRASRALMALMFHGAMRAGVQDLPALMRDAGFVDVEGGNTSFGPIGFVRGRTV